MRVTLILLCIAAPLALAACSSGSSSGAPPATAGTSSTTSATTTATVKNLVIGSGVRAQLVAAGAALHKLPSTDYTGLVPGETYYAYDPATKTYWAGASLVARSTSIQAQIGNQDDGAYLVFDRPAGGSWRAYDAGIPGDTHFTCSMKVPAPVLAAWHWTPGSCHPPSA